MGNEERRNLHTRAVVEQCVTENVVQKPGVVFNVEVLRLWCNVPRDAAERILARLASCGLVREVKQGIFVRLPYLG